MSFGPSGPSSRDALAPMRAAFLQECTESLGELEAGLLVLRDGEADGEQLNTIFRAVHSIKGGAGMFGLGELTRFAHVFETTLDGLRTGRLEPTSAVVKVLLRAADVLADLVTAAQDATPVDDAACAAVAAELTALEPADRAGDAGDDGGFTPVMVDIDSMFEPVAAGGSWRIDFVPHAALYESANEPLPFLRELQRLGDYRVELDAANLPALDQLDPGEAYLGWTVRLDAQAGAEEIGEIFDFVEGVCDLRIEQDMSGAVAGLPPAEGQPQPTPDPPAGIPTARPPTDAARPTREVANPTIRVDLERVDRLINLVSELVISEATLTERASLVGDRLAWRCSRRSTICAPLPGISRKA